MYSEPDTTSCIFIIIQPASVNFRTVYKRKSDFPNWWESRYREKVKNERIKPFLLGNVHVCFGVNCFINEIVFLAADGFAADVIWAHRNQTD